MIGLLQSSLIDAYSFYFLLAIAIVYLVFYLIHPIVVPKDGATKEKCNINISSKPIIREKIKLITWVCILFVAFVIIGYYFAHKDLIIVYLTYTLIVITLIIYLILIPHIIWFIFKYIITETQEDFSRTAFEGSVLVLSFSIIIFTLLIPIEYIQNIISFLSLNLSIIFFDMSLIIILITWYVAIFFFSFTYIILILDKINIFTKNRYTVKPQEECMTEKERIKVPLLSTKISELIDKQLKKKSLKIVVLFFIWFICIMIDILPKLLELSIYVIRDVIIWSVNIMCRMPIKYSKAILRIVFNNHHKTITIFSRLSLIGSLIIVFLINSYNPFLSDAGGRMLEFICSVIIIPVVITQLIEIGKTKKNLNESNHNKT